jgi:hypothetical protein
VLNLYLRQFANQDQKRGLCRVYVLTDHRRIVGYYSISAYSVASDDLTDQVRAGGYRDCLFCCWAAWRLHYRFRVKVLAMP